MTDLSAALKETKNATTLRLETNAAIINELFKTRLFVNSNRIMRKNARDAESKKYTAMCI